MDDEIKNKIERHLKFWNREDTGKPLTVAYLADDFFFSTHYKAAQPLLEPGKLITPDMLDVSEFLPDYERMYLDSLQLEQDGFFVATPYTGIPWMEAMLGCPVIGTENSFVSKPTGATIENLGSIELDPDNPWLAKYLEFTEALTGLSDGRFPVGQPIMRGPSDMLGSILGQEAMVLAAMMHPEEAQTLFQQTTKTFLQVIKKQEVLIHDYHGGRSIGFYNVWTPGKCIWYQEDLSALLSPDLFKQMLRPCGEIICKDYDYTVIHLHPSSFFIVDELLQMNKLKAIQVNKDVGGPSVAEMMALLKKIIDKKNLILWGDFDERDLKAILDHLPTSGVYLHIIAKDISRANQLLRIISRSASS